MDASATNPSAAATWILDLPTGVDPIYMSAFPNGTARIEANGNQHYLLYTTTDFGATWTAKKEEGILGGAPEIHFATPNAGFRLLSEDLSRTADGGSTWDPIPAPPTGPDQWFSPESLGLVPGNPDGLAVGGRLFDTRNHSTCYPTIAYSIFTSQDRGVTWRRSDLPSASYRADFAFFDATTAAVTVTDSPPSACSGSATADGSMASSDGGSVVYVTHDSGITWDQVFSCPGPYICATAAFVTPERLVIAGAEGATEISDDGGQSFRKGQTLKALKPSTTLHTVEGLAFVGLRGYANTGDDGIWRTDDGGSTWQNEPATHSVVKNSVVWWRKIAMFNADAAIAGGAGGVLRRLPTPLTVS